MVEPPGTLLGIAKRNTAQSHALHPSSPPGLSFIDIEDRGGFRGLHRGFEGAFWELSGGKGEFGVYRMVLPARQSHIGRQELTELKQKAYLCVADPYERYFNLGAKIDAARWKLIVVTFYRHLLELMGERPP